MKFRLNESNINEDYSPTIPPVLRAWLGKSSHRSGNSYRVNTLMRLGIDPNKATFKEVPVPTSNRDPFFKLEGVTKVYDLGNSGIYFEGINDDTDFIRSDGKRQPGKYLPAKEIMTLAKHIYLVDPQETAGGLNAIKDVRRGYKKDEIKRYTDDEIKRRGFKKYDPRRNTDRWTTYVDKSGYIVDPERLTRKIAELGIFNPGKKINKLNDEIILVRNNIASTFEEFVDSGRMDVDLMNNIKSAMSYLSDAAYYYNQINDRLDDMERNKASYSNGKLPPERLKAYKQTIDSYISSANTNVRNAENRIKQYLGTMVDWDTDEEDI